MRYSKKTTKHTWVRVKTALPARLKQAEIIYAGQAGARLALFAGWDQQGTKRIWWELHTKNGYSCHDVMEPPTDWADNILRRLEL